jgi:tRNA pseudouridine32 synthase/23S rRNA pseudouridine746 synthase
MSNPSSPADLARITDTLRTTYWSWVLYTADDGPSSLLALLKERLPHIDPTTWTERFSFGGVYVNGREALGDCALPLPCKVEYYEPKFSLASAFEVFPPFEERFVVYADDSVAVVYKPPRLSSMPAKEQRHFSLKAYLDRFFGCSIHMPSRLDVSAQGLVAVSINPATHAKLQQAFECRLVEKTYYLATSSPVPWQSHTVNLPIERDAQHPVLRIARVGTGDTALTHFERSHEALSSAAPVTVVRARPVTGRTHQIRVHAASQSIPITGDNFYGGAHAEYLHLVSFSVRFPHPLTGAQCSVTLPSEFRPEWLDNLSPFEG